MTEFQQNFNPPINFSLKDKDDIRSVATRTWKIETNEKMTNIVQSKGYIGSNQIEEVWKRYSNTEKRFSNIYISNYGYVVEIPNKKAKTLSVTTQKALETEQGMAWNNMEYSDKKIFHDCIYDSNANQHLIKYKYCSSVSMRVCLCVKYKYKELHKMVAEKFLESPKEKGYIVHHIDNNSYNNNVTNLIYLKAETHQGNQHKIFHPMSWK